MRKKPLFYVLFVLVILISDHIPTFGQTLLDHKVLIDQLKNSNTIFYKDCIRKYNSYLEKNPEDIPVLIEKCKFIQSAQYDADEEENPNQAEFDSCVARLAGSHPFHPDVLVYQTSYLWGDELENVFRKARESIKNSPGQWTKINLGTLYSKLANRFYENNSYDSANACIEKAISFDSIYKSSLDYAKILMKLKKKDKALSVLMSNNDTTRETWILQQKANLLMELKAYSSALALFNTIDRIDSTYNNNFEISSTLSAVGEYDLARKYLVADTSKSWDKKSALKNLLVHDIAHKDASTCYETYNIYRDLGYTADPLGIYRIRLFISHPLQAWKLRDIAGIISLLFVFLVLILLPSLWIFPIYFIGTHWNLINSRKSYEPVWGLKMFWVVSVIYLVASIIPYFSVPDYFYSLFSGRTELPQDKKALTTLIFILIFAIGGLLSLRKKDPVILLSSNWSRIKCIMVGFGFLFVFKIIAFVWLKFGAIMGISKNELLTVLRPLLSARADIDSIIATYGKLPALLLIGIIAPFYEEIIFRGVILDSTMRYINFGFANVIQAFLFSLIHLNLFLIPVYFLFGIFSGIMRKRSGGLLTGIAFHSFNNLFAVLLMITIR